MKQLTFGLIMTFGLLSGSIMAQEEIEKKYTKEVERLAKKNRSKKLLN